MKLAVLLAIFTSLLGAQLTAPPASTTDERIRNVERQLHAFPREAKLLTSLVAAYLQKLRETADGAWLDRASQLVDRLSV
jgi:hypothetical protein